MRLSARPRRCGRRLYGGKKATDSRVLAHVVPVARVRLTAVGLTASPLTLEIGPPVGRPKAAQVQAFFSNVSTRWRHTPRLISAMPALEVDKHTYREESITKVSRDSGKKRSNKNVQSQTEARSSIA